MIHLANKNALITGASSGIGAAIAKRLAKEGCNLFLTGQNGQRLLETKEICGKEGVKVHQQQCDFSEFQSIDKLANAIKEIGFHIDLFILNAGVSQRSRGFDTDFETDRKIMQVNYWSHVYLIKKFKDEILASEHVNIAVTTSLAGLFGFPLRTSYCSSKHALFGFFESLDLEYQNINVTFLIPGRINTPISKSALLGNGEKYGQMDPGQANGLDADEAAAKAVKAVRKEKHRQLIGKSEILMAYINRYMPWLYYKIAKNISPT